MSPDPVDVDDDEIQCVAWRQARPPLQPARLHLPPPTNTRSRKTRVLHQPANVQNRVTEPIVISSDEELEGPPAKRQKTQAAVAGPSNPKLKRKHPGGEPEIKTRIGQPPRMQLDEATGEIIDDPSQRKKQKSFPFKTGVANNPIEISDSDDDIQEDNEESDSDYDNLHDGYDIGWSTYDVEPDRNLFERDVDEVGEAVARLHLDRIDPRIVHNSRLLAPLPVLEATHSTQKLDIQYKGASSFRRYLPTKMRGPVYASYCGGRSRTGMLKHRPSKLQSPLNRLHILHRFRMADGIHSIVQSGPNVLVASSTPGGTTDDETSAFRVDPYNSLNTLALYTERMGQDLLGLCRTVLKHDQLLENVGLKHIVSLLPNKNTTMYCVLNLTQPSTSNILLTTGHDGHLVLWKNTKVLANELQNRKWASSSYLEQEDSEYQYLPVAKCLPVAKYGQETYQGVCRDIIFRPQRRLGERDIFAAPCDNGAVFLYAYTQDGQVLREIQRLRVGPQTQTPPRAGATVWGQQSTSNMLFVCSEAEEDHDAYHGAFDITTGQRVYWFDQHENGEELVLNPKGDTLALFTTQDSLDSLDSLRLHLYDVKRNDSQRSATIYLPSPSKQLPRNTQPEVSVSSWSPDGILLAVGCNDDVAHVYDVRCLERGPVHSLMHKTRSSSRGMPLLSLPPAERAESRYFFGITVLNWTTETCYKSPGLGLLTGGGDHCVALWDVGTSCEERHVVAELDGHVGCAHFGDLSKGEKPLVAGDIDGHVYVYDFVERV